MSKILILVQIANCMYIDNLFSKILKYNNGINLFLISIDKSIFVNLKQYNLLNYRIFTHDNIGMDIGPYLLQLLWMCNNLHNNSYDYIYKIHTKSNQKWFDELTDIDIDDSGKNIYMAEKWKFNLDNLNIFHINTICVEHNIKNIYYDEFYDNTVKYDEIDEQFYASYYDLSLNNCDTISRLLGYDVNRQFIYDHAIKNNNIVNEKYISVKRKHKTQFCAGSIFIINYKLTYDFFKTINIKKLYSHLEPEYTANDHSTYVHALERIVSSFFL
jgi:hypothetical protein